MWLHQSKTLRRITWGAIPPWARNPSGIAKTASKSIYRNCWARKKKKRKTKYSSNQNCTKAKTNKSGRTISTSTRSSARADSAKSGMSRWRRQADSSPWRKWTKPKLLPRKASTPSSIKESSSPKLSIPFLSTWAMPSKIDRNCTWSWIYSSVEICATTWAAEEGLDSPNPNSLSHAS